MDSMIVDDMATEPDCPPTFNIQEEVVVFHHTGRVDLPWSTIFTMVTTRHSNDVNQFRQGPGLAVVHCLIKSDAISDAQRRMFIILIETCLPPRDTKITSPLAIAEVYQNLQQEHFEHPHSIRLAYRNRRQRKSDGKVETVWDNKGKEWGKPPSSGMNNSAGPKERKVLFMMKERSESDE
ncbi:hypothetical protein FIBSPDRAFT_963822 [Athelia psychrophila]|uniref:Uncharacterized protein n=1 Tax=Athelia psychrophila TaxID=1759441 RepID=A0A165YJF8_9AGAM|nr:hypothetical protein FIBSPDRAFT_963822 [Fibularhizoctonia sp. CBS 109695]